MSDTNNCCLKRKHKDMNDENYPPPPGFLQTLENMILSSEARIQARFDHQEAQVQAQFNQVQARLDHQEAQVQAQFNQVQARLDHQAANLTSIENLVEAMHGDVRNISYPLDGANQIASCVIDSGDHAVLSTNKKCVFTWVQYPEQTKPHIVGAAHCALTIRTHWLNSEHNSFVSSDVTFLELPLSILKKGVLKAFLLAHDDGKFTNPLPLERDMIMIQVEEDNPPGSVCLINPPAVGVQERTSVCTLAAGLAHGSVVSNKDGLVSVQPGALPHTGTVSFIINVAESGDSGTLLHTKCENQVWMPAAVFHGLIRPLHPHATRRGIAAILPPFSSFGAPLDVVDVFELYPSENIRCHVSTKDETFTCEVESVGLADMESVGPKAVTLVSKNGNKKYGVFVRNKKPIEYIGEKEFAMMNGSMMHDPSIDRNKRSFSDYSEE
jgi:hypothetical protein